MSAETFPVLLEACERMGWTVESAPPVYGLDGYKVSNPATGQFIVFDREGLMNVNDSEEWVNGLIGVVSVDWTGHSTTG